REKGALKRRQRARYQLEGDIGGSDAEGGAELLRVARISPDDAQKRLRVFESVLISTEKGLPRLFLQGASATVPKLARRVGGIEHRRSVAGAEKTVGADRDLAAVGESPFRLVAGGATDAAVRAEALVMEKPLAQGDLGRALRIAGRDRHGGKSQRGRGA